MSRTAPRVFYGWWMLAGLSVTQIVGWGVLYYAFGALMTPMRAEFGGSRSPSLQRAAVPGLRWYAAGQVVARTPGGC